MVRLHALHSPYKNMKRTRQIFDAVRAAGNPIIAAVGFYGFPYQTFMQFDGHMSPSTTEGVVAPEAANDAQNDSPPESEYTRQVRVPEIKRDFLRLV